MKELFVDLKNYRENLDQKNLTKVNRKAARGIIIREGKLLCIHSKYGDYKFPGGGVKVNESLEDTLIREVKEETGYTVKKNSIKLEYLVHEKRKGEIEDLMIMESFYFVCSVNNEVVKQQLDDYEKEYDYQALWLSINEIINKNEKCSDLEHVPWIIRDNLVFKEIQKSLV